MRQKIQQDYRENTEKLKTNESHPIYNLRIKANERPLSRYSKIKIANKQISKTREASIADSAENEGHLYTLNVNA